MIPIVLLFPSGKLLPGVPKNAINLAIQYDYDNWNASLNHVWRDRSFIFDDFNNNANMMSPSYESTNAFVRYNLKNMFYNFQQREFFCVSKQYF